MKFDLILLVTMALFAAEGMAHHKKACKTLGEQCHKTKQCCHVKGITVGCVANKCVNTGTSLDIADIEV